MLTILKKYNLHMVAMICNFHNLQPCHHYFTFNTRFFFNNLAFTYFYWICCSGVSPGRGICCAVIIVGLFISSEPQIWGLNTQQTEDNASNSLLQRVLWPMCFALGFVPFALVNLTCEKVLTRRNVKITIQ